MDDEFPCQGFYVTERRLNVGDIVAPGRWGRTILTAGHRHLRYATEEQLENHRAAAHPMKPSRFESNFCFATLDQARWYRDSHFPGQAIYEIGFDADRFAYHQGFILCIPPHQNMTDEQAIQSYWNCDTQVFDVAQPDMAPIEIVTLSPMCVRRNVE